ncbi:MAG: hypothetical protein V4596_00345 [Bdellovibrionota bacterium]
MKDTLDLYGTKKALNNYLVIIPPKEKPSYVPDEFALVGLSSEQTYREIRATPAGENYSAKHWDIFDKETSSSAKTFIDYSKQPPQNLTHNAAYDMLGEPIDWSSGYNRVYIGLRKDHLDSQNFLLRLKNHIESVKNQLGTQGLKGYIVLANENYEVAYMNWTSKEDFDKAQSSSDFKIITEDAQQFMDNLMYAEAIDHNAGEPISYGMAYSTLSKKSKTSPRTIYKCYGSSDDLVENDIYAEVFESEKKLYLSLEMPPSIQETLSIDRIQEPEILFYDIFMNREKGIELEVFLDDMGSMSSLTFEKHKYSLSCE